MDSRTQEITLLAEDLAKHLHGEGGTLDLNELLILLEVASGKLTKWDRCWWKITATRSSSRFYFSSIRTLVAAAHKRVEEIRWQELR